MPQLPFSADPLFGPLALTLPATPRLRTGRPPLQRPGLQVEIRRVEIVLACDADKGEKGIASRVGERRPHRRGAAASAILQTGHSDDSHSPDEWASVVVRRINPASLSIAMPCTVAISCPPSALRTMSRPLDTPHSERSDLDRAGYGLRNLRAAPILEPEPADANELPRVVRHDFESSPQGTSCEQQIIGSYRRTLAIQACA